MAIYLITGASCVWQRNALMLALPRRGQRMSHVGLASGAFRGQTCGAFRGYMPVGPVEAVPVGPSEAMCLWGLYRLHLWGL